MKKIITSFSLILFSFTITLISCGDTAKTDIVSDSKEVCEESVKKECCLSKETDTTLTETITE